MKISFDITIENKQEINDRYESLAQVDSGPNPWNNWTIYLALFPFYILRHNCKNVLNFFPRFTFVYSSSNVSQSLTQNFQWVGELKQGKLKISFISTMISSFFTRKHQNSENLFCPKICIIFLRKFVSFFEQTLNYHFHKKFRKRFKRYTNFAIFHSCKQAYCKAKNVTALVL